MGGCYCSGACLKAGTCPNTVYQPNVDNSGNKYYTVVLKSNEEKILDMLARILEILENKNNG